MSTANDYRIDSSLTKKDFQTDQEVRWCPGCGDYAILSAVQAVFPELGIPREKFVVISGIGCSSRFPYYMNTFGFHTIHGRAPAVATGVKIDASGARSLGGDRRRRFALHRRQSHDSHAAPQRRHQGADVQQQDLRADQGPVLADVRIRQENQVDSVRHRRSAVQSAGPGDRRGDYVRGALGGRLPATPEGHAEESGGAQGLGLRRDSAELQHLQRSARGSTSPKKKPAASTSSSSNTASR